MRRPLILLITLLYAPSAASAALITVGPTGQYASVGAAITASHSGDTINVAAGTYTNDYALIDKQINLVAVGGRVNMVNTAAAIPNGKGIFIINTNLTSAPVSITGFNFSGARVADGNGAGIRMQGGQLTLTNDWFHDNQMGLLNGGNRGSLTIRNSEFGPMGTAGGGQLAHDLYVGQIANLSIDRSYFHDAKQGHEIKSRALNTTITNSRIFDNNGTASYNIDLPNGGNATLQNNVIQQGPNSPNAAMISYGYGPSGLPMNPGLSFILDHNMFVNDKATTGAHGIQNNTTTPARFANNSFWGLTAAQIANGTNTQSGDIFLATRPLLDLSHPWTPLALAAPIIESAVGAVAIQEPSTWMLLIGGIGLLAFTLRRRPCSRA